MYSNNPDDYCAEITKHYRELVENEKNDFKARNLLSERPETFIDKIHGFAIWSIIISIILLIIGTIFQNIVASVVIGVTFLYLLMCLFICGVTSIVNAKRNAKYRKRVCTSRGQAFIIDHTQRVKRTSGRRGPLRLFYSPVYRYMVNGEEVHLISLEEKLQPRDIGEYSNILYNPNNPWDVIFLDNKEDLEKPRFTSGIILICISLFIPVLTVIGVIFGI